LLLEERFVVSELTLPASVMDNDVEVIFEVVNEGLSHFIAVLFFNEKPGWKL